MSVPPAFFPMSGSKDIEGNEIKLKWSTQNYSLITVLQFAVLRKSCAKIVGSEI